MSLKNALLGWLLIGGMVVYALALTVIHAGRTIVDLARSLGGKDSPSASSP